VFEPSKLENFALIANRKPRKNGEVAKEGWLGCLELKAMNLDS